MTQAEQKRLKTQFLPRLHAFRRDTRVSRAIQVFVLVIPIVLLVAMVADAIWAKHDLDWGRGTVLGGLLGVSGFCFVRLNRMQEAVANLYVIEYAIIRGDDARLNSALSKMTSTDKEVFNDIQRIG